MLKSEDLFSDPQAVFNQTSRFLELEPEKLTNPKPVNAGKYATLDDANPELARQLYEHYRPCNDELYRYLDMDFGWERLWQSP